MHAGSAPHRVEPEGVGGVPAPPDIRVSWNATITACNVLVDDPAHGVAPMRIKRVHRMRRLRGPEGIVGKVFQDGRQGARAESLVGPHELIRPVSFQDLPEKLGKRNPRVIGLEIVQSHQDGDGICGLSTPVLFQNSAKLLFEDNLLNGSNIAPRNGSGDRRHSIQQRHYRFIHRRTAAAIARACISFCLAGRTCSRTIVGKNVLFAIVPR